MQLVAYGAQDIYLTGNPQITFFKVVYRRHTNFSMESISQTFSGDAAFGSDVTATISRNGDLVHRMYLEHTASFTAGDAQTSDQMCLVERYGDSLIKECEIEIGGQKIDKHYSMWNRVWSDLTEFNPNGHFGALFGSADMSDHDTAAAAQGDGTLYQKMTGNGYGLNTATYGDDTNDLGVNNATVNGFTYATGTVAVNASINIGRIFIPLNFWFCRNPGLALPLIALQYHEVKVKMTFEQLVNLGRNDNAAGDLFGTSAVGFIEGSGDHHVAVTSDFKLWCDYIYLDTDERRRFAQVSHEYLIEQLQRSENTITTSTPSIELNFNHPVKELIWTTRNIAPGASHGRCAPMVAATSGDASAGPVSIETFEGDWKLTLNGHERFKERDTKYFTRTQVWQHHTGYGGIPTFGITDTNLDSDIAQRMGSDSIAVYSFALKPEEHQPSGTCNFSRIDTAQLVGSTISSVRGNGTQARALVGEAGAESVLLTIFAVNYNVLRIMSGMGGLAYSN